MHTEFKAEPWYNQLGDCVEYQTVDEAIIADGVDGFLTAYRSGVDRRLIGFQLHQVRSLLSYYGFRLEPHSLYVEKDLPLAVLVLFAFQLSTSDSVVSVQADRAIAYAAIMPDQGKQIRVYQRC